MIQKPRKVKYFLDKMTYFTESEAKNMSKFLSGSTVREIAKIFNVSPNTTQSHLNNMKSKLNCSSKRELTEKVKNSRFMDYKNLSK